MNLRFKGMLHEAKGGLTEAAGKLAGNPKLQAKGMTEKAIGKVQITLARAKGAFTR